MGKISKIILITLLIIVCLVSLGNKVYAISDPNIFKPDDPTDYEDFAAKAGTALRFVRNIGAVISVLGIAILGIRYMLGSLEEKANYKETMIPFVIGLVILVAITTIVTIVQEVAKSTG